MEFIIILRRYHNTQFSFLRQWFDVTWNTGALDCSIGNLAGPSILTGSIFTGFQRNMATRSSKTFDIG